MNPPCRSLKLNSIHLLIFGILCAPQAIAEDKKTTSLDTIVVTADRNEKSIWDSSLSISAVNAEEISKQNGDSIAETLRDIPGVEITDNSMAGRKQISIRGEAPSRMLILIDGQEVSYHRSGHGSSAGLLIDMESVERIEVIKGPHSVLYGSQAIGGVVNFITRKGSTEHEKFAGRLKTVYNGATNGFTGQGSVYGSIEDFDYRLSGSYSDQGDRKTKEGRLKDTGFDNKSGSAWFGYKINQHKFGLSLEHYNIDTNTYYAYNPREPEIKEFSVKIPKLTRDKVGFFYDYDMGGIIDKIHFDTYYQKLDREFRNNILVAPAPMMAIRTATETNDTQDSLGMTLQANIIPHKDMSLITGIQYQQDVVDQTSHTKNRINTPIPVMDYVSDKTSKNKWQQSSISLFAQNDWQFAKDFNWNLGIRQYWIESKVKNGHSLTTKTPTVGAITYTSQTDKPRSDSHNNIVISTGLTYNGFKDTILRASFGQGYVYPTLAHLYSITSAHQQTIYGNPDLKAEKSNNYELGLRYNNNTWVVDSSLYYSTAKNYITDMICNGSSICSGATSSTTRYYENANKAKTYGAELSVEYVNWDIIPYIKGNYIRRQIETDTYTTYQTGTPTFMATTGLKNTHFFEHFDLDSDLFIRAATHSKNYSGSTVYYYGGWSTLNLSLVASFGQQKQYQLGFDLNNILNKNYTTARESIPAAKINAVISASMKF